MARAAEFNRSLQVWVEQTLSPEAQSKFLAKTAREERDQLIKSGRASPTYRTFVDGTIDKSEDLVQPAPSGKIIYAFSGWRAITTAALKILVDNSPVLTGNYKKSFYLGIDGKFVPMEQFNADAIGFDVKEVVIGNTQPYSRKVDVQLVGGKKLNFSVPPLLFDNAVKELKSQFGRNFTIKRVYTMEFPGQYVLRQEQYHKSGRNIGKPRKRAGQLVESPALIIQPL